VKALVLAAGRGERLRPLTDNSPKPLLEAGGRPLIHYALLLLRRAGVTEVAINLHHLGDRLRSTLGDGSALDMSITYSPEPVLLGTGGPLPGLREYFAGEPFIVMNSDTIIDLDLTRVIEFHRNQRALATFVLRKLVKPDVYSELEVDADGRLIAMRLLVDRAPKRIAEYRPPGASSDLQAAAHCMFCGISICEPVVLDLPAPPPPFSLMGDLFAPALAAGRPLAAYLHSGYFRTVDDLAGYETIAREFKAMPPALAYLG